MVYVIAEIGVNHNGSMDLATKLIDEAKRVGANAVKFQSFSAAKLCKEDAPKVPYQNRDQSQSHFSMLQKLELSRDEQINLFQYCDFKGIDFISTPYDVDNAVFLNDLGVKYFKTASADLIDYKLQKFISNTKIQCLIAVGMADYEEIDVIVDMYKKAVAPDPVLLHCVSSYPCSDKSLNMAVINSLQARYGLEIGFSDHSVDNFAAQLSVSMGCKVIEKHFTLSKKMEGPDHAASTEPDDFYNLIESINRAALILGSKEKEIQKEEWDMKKYSRKSIYLARDVDKGSLLELDDLEAMRPGIGISPLLIPKIVGKRLGRKLIAGQLLSLDDFTDEKNEI
jgi:sialic acid synthase SpsE